MDVVPGRPETEESSRGLTGASLDGISVHSPEISISDEKSKGLLLMLSLSAYTDWQRAFLGHYRKLLHIRAGSSVSSLKEECYALCSLLETSLDQKCPIFGPHSRDCASVPPTNEQSSDDSTALDPNEQSLLRYFWRAYRMEVYLKIILIIFLLKLPFPCYIITSLFYVSYCLGSLSIVTRAIAIIRNHPITLALLRSYLSASRFLTPLFTGLQNQSDSSVAVATSVQTAKATSGDDDDTVSGEKVDDLGGEYAAIKDDGCDTEQKHISPEENSSEYNLEISTSTLEKEEPSTTETFEGRDAEHSSCEATREIHGMISLREASGEGDDVISSTNQEATSTFHGIEKAIYQLVVSFILSLLPWWEPSSSYV